MSVHNRCSSGSCPACISDKNPNIEEAILASLTGVNRHFCGDWDFMAIDETCPEFECCTHYDHESNV